VGRCLVSTSIVNRAGGPRVPAVIRLNPQTIWELAMRKPDKPGRLIGIGTLMTILCSPLVACGGSTESNAMAGSSDPAMKSYHDYVATSADTLVSTTKAF